jgi:hypothetical protein
VTAVDDRCSALVSLRCAAILSTQPPLAQPLTTCPEHGLHGPMAVQGYCVAMMCRWCCNAGASVARVQAQQASVLMEATKARLGCKVQHKFHKVGCRL